MENKEEIIINDNLTKPKVKKQKPLTEEQREKQKNYMRNYYLARKNPEYIERQRLSSKTHYYKHKEEERYMSYNNKDL